MAPGAVSLGATSRRLGERAIRVALFAAAAVSVLTTLGILVALLRETIAFFGDVGIGRFITDGEWAPLFAPPQYGIWQLINGTFLVTGIAILVAIPLGLGLGDLPRPSTPRREPASSSSRCSRSWSACRRSSSATSR